MKSKYGLENNLHQTAREYSFLTLLVQLEARVIAD